ncbi:MAG: class I adenylate-forming enzyme family protein [Polyangiales bacterium]
MTELSLLAAAAEEPARDCLVAHGRRWSFEEVAARVRVAMHTLLARGVRSGDRVALSPNVDVDSIVWLYALFELGCPAVLLHPRLTERERKVQLSRAKQSHVIRERVPVGGAPSPHVESNRIPSARTLAVVFTSGTRGEPRGARLSRRAFLASAGAHASNLGWLPDDRWLLCMPPAHVGGLSIITRSLIARRAVVLGPGAFDPSALIGLIDEERVSMLSFVPTMLRRMLASSDPVWIPNEALRAVLVGGAPMPQALAQRAADRSIPVLATYGCTEACSQVATQRPGQSGSIGSGAPLAGIELRVEGEEIQLRGDVLMDGYLAEEPGDENWTPDGWFRSGDFGELLPDGQLLVRGRLDGLIVTGGENVAPQEVEAWLETVSGITGACVFARPSEDWGEEVVAAIVTDPALFRIDDFRARLEAELAPHKRPKRFCLLDSLPLNRSGKVERRAVEANAGPKLRAIWPL